jgi:hypothetical protein
MPIRDIRVTSAPLHEVNALCTKLGVSYGYLTTQGGLEKIKFEETRVFVPNTLLYVDSLVRLTKLQDKLRLSKVLWSVVAFGSEGEASEFSVPYTKTLSSRWLISGLATKS